jgi:(p)ppGpp synthase/HD superfamily hydrolase
MLKGIDEQLELCRKISRNAHCTQMRNDGVTPYLNHIERVVRTVGSNKYLQCIAWLHDTLEDTDVVPAALSSFGVEDGIIARTLVLTHNPNKTYNQYIGIIRETKLHGCIAVKIADIVSNLSDAPSPHQMKKYFKALLILSKTV